MVAKKNDTTETTAIQQFSMSEYEAKILATLQGWEQDATGFAPYFKVNGPGDCFFGRICTVDERDPNFIRYVVECKNQALECQRGPVDGAEKVMVQPGEFFTISAYSGLPIERYFDMEVFCKVKSEKDLPPNKNVSVKHSTFEWQVLVSPNDMKTLRERRSDELKLLMERRTLSQGDKLLTATASA